MFVRMNVIPPWHKTRVKTYKELNSLIKSIIATRYIEVTKDIKEVKDMYGFHLTSVDPKCYDILELRVNNKKTDKYYNYGDTIYIPELDIGDKVVISLGFKVISDNLMMRSENDYINLTPDLYAELIKILSHKEIDI